MPMTGILVKQEAQNVKRGREKKQKAESRKASGPRSQRFAIAAGLRFLQKLPLHFAAADWNRPRSVTTTSGHIQSKR
jgi:hypothetical protein